MSKFFLYRNIVPTIIKEFRKILKQNHAMCDDVWFIATSVYFNCCRYHVYTIYYNDLHINLKMLKTV